jgi:hypothetical protein
MKPHRMPALGTRVLWSAICDPIDTERPVPLWAVKVWSEPPHTYERNYDIEAPDEGHAVNKAALAFIEEVECLIDADG